jgi:hypothetical protein
MSLSAWEQQALDSIRAGLAGSDPQLATMLAAFTELASGEDMPARENLRPSPLRSIRSQRRKRLRLRLRPDLHPAYRRLRLHWALLLWLVVTAAIIGTGFILSRSGNPAPCPAAWPVSCPRQAPASSPAAAPAGHVSG